MVMMAKNRNDKEPVGAREEVDCRTCLHYPKPNTTGKVEDFISKTENWTKSFCGAEECEDKKYAKVGEEESVNKGDTDEPEKTQENPDDLEHTE